MKTFSVYYMRPDFFRDGIMGVEWLKQQNKLPDPGALDRTHIFLGEFKAAGLEQLYVALQGENWSPNGEGLEHTSMSVGDLAVDQDTWAVHIVDRFGFYEVHPGGDPIGEAAARMAAADDVTYPERRDE